MEGFLCYDTQVMRKILLGIVLVIIFLFVSVAATIGFVAYRVSNQFFSAAHVKPLEFISTLQKGWKTFPDQSGGVVSFLVLGLDEVAGRNEPVLTDTNLLVLLHWDTGHIDLISIPRDLWIDEYKTKINALYFYGTTKYPDHPEQFPKEVVEKITGVPIQYVVPLKLSQVGALIDTLGGVDVEVQHSFTDALFPRPGVDVAVVKDPKLLYETVSFKQGTEHMNGARALTFIRSRHSTDLIEGTDDARSLRQQQVITAVMKRVMGAVSQFDLKTLGNLYAFYQSTYGNIVPPVQLIAIGKALGQNVLHLSFQPHDIMPLFRNPPIKKYGQWVYEPIDPTWGALQHDIQASSAGIISR